MKTAKTSCLLFVLFVFTAFFFDSCASPKSEMPADTVVQVDSMVRNLGELVQNKAVETVFRIKNVGNAPLSISDVTADCHCTVPLWDTSDVKPNEYAEIRVKYDAHGLGIFQQAVNIDLNTKEKHITCLIRGKVVEAAKK